MKNLISWTLARLGLYTPLRRTVCYLSDPTLRRRESEIRQDIERTRREVEAWAAQKVQSANPNHIFAIISFTNLPLHAKFHAISAKLMQLRGFTPLIFTYSGCRYAHEYFRMFGIDQLIFWDNYVQKALPDQSQVSEIVKTLLPTEVTTTKVISLKFKGVEVGKHALSMTSRRRVEGRLDLSHPQTFSLFHEQLTSAVRGVLVMEQIINQYPINKMLIRDAGYIPNGSIYELALEKGIDCIVYEQGQRRGTWILKRYTPQSKGQHYFSLADSTWEKVRRQPWTPEDDQKLEQEFAGRYRTDSTDDTRRLQAGKLIKTPEQVRTQLGLDPAKKTAVIFSHIAWDAAFFFGTCLFEDFEQWLFETVKYIATECPHLNWVVKLHPFNVFKLQRESKTEESEMRLLRSLMPLPDHIKIMRADTDINTQSLFPVVDYVLTVNGTVGMEFPCYGVPAVLAGTGRYNGRGFTIDPRTREEYFNTLKILHTIPPLDVESRRLARLHFYTLTNRRQVSLEDVAPMELKRLNEAQSDVHDNISITARTLDQFYSAPSIRLLAGWLGDSNELDLLEPQH